MIDITGGLPYMVQGALGVIGLAAAGLIVLAIVRIARKRSR